MKNPEVFLVFAPKRTRPYKYNVYDMANNLFLPFAHLEAVCLTREDTKPVIQEIIERLRDDCPKYDDAHGKPGEHFDWLEAIKLTWKWSVSVIRFPLVGTSNGIIKLKTVHVVLETDTEYISGTGRTYDRLYPAKVTANRSEARAYAEPGVHTIVDHELVGFVPA